MNIFTLIKKNIRWNIKNYLLYFCSIVFIITVVFSFNCLQQSEQIVSQVGASMGVLLKIGAFFIYIFAFIFLWYSNTFFTKNRKKEVGLYSLLGLPKRKIANMLFAENIIVGSLAMLVGLAIGSLLSKYMIMFLFKMMAMYIDVSYEIPMDAIANTVVGLGIMFVIISIHSYSLIYRFKLIEFFNASKKNEKMPKGSIAKGIMGIGLIAAGYAVALSDFVAMFPLYVITVLTLVILGTYQLFLSSLVIAGKLSKKNTKRYYSGLNMIGTSNFIYRVKSNAYVLGSIAILSAVTISAVGMSFGFYHGIVEDSKIYSPVSYQYEKTNTENMFALEDIIDKNASASDILLDKTVELKSREIPVVSEYKSNVNVRVMKLSDFKVLNDYHKLGFSENLKQGESYYFENTGMGMSLFKEEMAQDIKLDNESVKIVQKGSNNLTTLGYIQGILVINDDLYAKLPNSEKFRTMTIRLLDFKDENIGRAIDKEWMALNNKEPKDYENLISYTSYTEGYDMQMQWRGMFMFSGVFLGLVILVSTGSMIYFKLLNEAAEEKERYEVLRKIGVSYKEIKKSISKQVFVMFSIPVIVGISHGIFAMGALSKLLGRSLIVSTGYIIAAFLVIYSVYYFLTVKRYNEVVNKAS